MWSASALASSDQRPCRALKERERITLDLREAPLRDVVRLVSCATSQNIIMEPASLSTARVTLIAVKPVSAEDILTLFHASLGHAGLVASSRGAYLVITRSASHSPSKRRSNKGR